MFFRYCGNHYHFSRKWFPSIFPLNTFIFIFLYQDLFVIAYGDQSFSRDQFVYGITTTVELFGVPWSALLADIFREKSSIFCSF